MRRKTLKFGAARLVSSTLFGYTEEECGEKLAELIREMKNEIEKQPKTSQNSLLSAVFWSKWQVSEA